MTFGSKYFLNSLAWESVSDTIETARSGSLRHPSVTGPRLDVRTVAGLPNLSPDGVTSLGTTSRSTKPPRKSKRGLNPQWNCKLDSRLAVVLERMSACVVVDESMCILSRIQVDAELCALSCEMIICQYFEFTLADEAMAVPL